MFESDGSLTFGVHLAAFWSILKYSGEHESLTIEWERGKDTVQVHYACLGTVATAVYEMNVTFPEDGIMEIPTFQESVKAIIPSEDFFTLCQGFKVFSNKLEIRGGKERV